MLPPSAERAAALTGVGLVVAAVTLFAVLDAAGKLLAEAHSVVQIVWARYAFAVPVLLAIVPAAAWPTLLRVRRPALQAGRALMPMLASFAVVVGLRFLPLAEVTALTFASPLVVVTLAGPLLRERSSVHDWVGVVLGFLGILVIVRPGGSAVAWAAVFPLACAVCFALFQLATRLVGRHDEPTATLAWTIGVGLAVTTPLLLVDWRPVTWTAWGLMAVSGLSFGGAQLLLIRAFRLAPAAVLTPFTYAQIVPAVLLGLVLFGAVPDLWAAIGTGILIAAGIYVVRRRVGTAGSPVPEPRPGHQPPAA
jgi:drug/metabolite transporter (DMT)-like permease